MAPFPNKAYRVAFARHHLGQIQKKRFRHIEPTCIDKKDADKNPALGSRFVRKWLSNFLSGQPNVIELREIQYFGGTYYGKVNV